MISNIQLATCSLNSEPGVESKRHSGSSLEAMFRFLVIHFLFSILSIFFKKKDDLSSPCVVCYMAYRVIQDIRHTIITDKPCVSPSVSITNKHCSSSRTFQIKQTLGCWVLCECLVCGPRRAQRMPLTPSSPGTASPLPGMMMN